MDQEIVYSIGAFLAATVLLYLYTKKKQNSQWRGSVTGIKHFTRSKTDSTNDDAPVETTHQVRIRYRKESGGKGKLVVTLDQFNAMFPNLKPGDGLIKKPGEFFPNSP